MSLTSPPDPLAGRSSRPPASGDVVPRERKLRRRPHGRLRLSPLNQRRWRNFKANRRGYWSLWLFLILFVVSLFADLIANDRPLLLKYDGKFFLPVVFNYSETTFGGDFETAADYRDPFLQKLIAEKGGWMIWPPVRYRYDTHNLDLPTPAPSKPTWLLSEQRSVRPSSSARA